MARIRVAVVFGGRSSEHPISVVSAGAVVAGLDPERYDVLPIGITREGRWVVPPEGQQMAIEGGSLPEVTGGAAVALPTTGGELVVLEPGEVPRALAAVDVVFPVLHGPYGEDGTLQGLFELAGVPYVGSGVFASAAAMDKVHMKALLASCGLPIGPYVVARPGESAPDAATAARVLTLPVFVKPARAGSSMGITKVTAWEQLDAAVAEARAHDPKVVIEQGLSGRELECGVLGGLAGAPPTASVAAEVRVVGGQDFYDFEAKYLDDATEFDIPAALSPAELAELQGLALRAFAALDCAGLARVDFFRTDGGTFVVNEVNTMPGFTPASMYPRMWAASGVTHTELVERLVALALEAGTGLR